MTQVWLLAISRFEWYEVKHICQTKETALKLFEDLRQELIADNQRMIDHCNSDNIDATHWQDSKDALIRMIPGEKLNFNYCDYPDLQGWDLE